MEKILLAELYTVEFEITDIDCYEYDESKDSSSQSRRHQLRCYGTAMAKSGDIDIFFFWHAFSFRSRYQNPSYYAVEMDDAGIITADINRKIVLDMGQEELDQVDANAILIRLIDERIDWKPAVLSGLPKPRFSVVNND